MANNSQNNDISNEYLDNLARKLFQDLVGYGEIDPLIRDDNLEEIMVIGMNKPVFVYHREYGMMKTNILFKDADELMNLIDSIARQINRRIDQNHQFWMVTCWTVQELMQQFLQFQQTVRQ